MQAADEEMVVMNAEKYDIFISYRREGGDILAMLLYTRLKEDGYEPFLDIETLRSGKFNSQLYERIAECKDFICVLPPNALDRCKNADDWVRLEVAKALELDVNIVPVMMRGFEFPSDMPADIAELKYYNGITSSREYFDAAYEKLKALLISEPHADIDDSASKSIQLQSAFQVTLEKCYKCLVEYRDAINEGDVRRINELSGPLQESLQSVYTIYERYQYVDEEIAGKAKEIVDKFNIFIGYFGRFIEFPAGESRQSPEAVRYASLATSTFSDLIQLVVLYLSQM